MSHWMIAGASRGIGLELARQLAARGEKVTASVRSEPGRERLATALAGLGASATILNFDTRDEAAMRAAAAKIDTPIDVLIVNAGTYGPQRQSSLDMDFDAVLELLSTNTLGPIRVAQAFLPLVKRGEAPRIGLMSSVLGSMSLSGTFNVGYRVSKAGLNKIAQCLAADLKSEGVAVIALHPGWVRTDMGGADAPLEATDSAAGIIKAMDALTLEGTGRFIDYRGEEIPW